ncbi:hypothetical protein [Sodalis-like endosymbiont of Proechinophthirus fluctus]|nr:hypothetical protein [Sodalis-like endosymbiont of Proechinophthirus fluctus]
MRSALDVDVVASGLNIGIASRQSIWGWWMLSGTSDDVLIE